MKKIILLTLLFVSGFSVNLCMAQGNPKIKIDGNSTSADPASGLKLPYWLNAGQTLAADQDVNAISVMEFTVGGTELNFSQILNVTTIQTVPTGKVWKIESVSFASSAGSITNWGLLGNGGTLSGTNFMGTTDAVDLTLKTSGTERIRVLSTGNVGIGTATPVAKLDISGDVNVAAVNGFKINNTAAAGQYLRGDGTRFVSSAIQSADLPSSALTWQRSGTNVTLINSGDNVGIGVAAPLEALDVNGSLIRKVNIVSGYGQEDGTDNGALANRIITVTKKYGAGVTGLRVTYSDAFRVIGGSACKWEVKFNGATCTTPSPLAFHLYEGSGGQDHHRFSTFVGTCKSVAAGAVTVQVYVSPTVGFSSPDCYTGWGNGTAMWELGVEEIRF